MARALDSTVSARSNVNGLAARKSRRSALCSQASRLALRSPLGIGAVVTLGLLAPTQAWAQCVVGGVTVTCSGDTSTTDTTYPTNPPNDRFYQGPIATPIILNVDGGVTVSGNGLAVTNTAGGGITVTNDGTISVDAGNTPTAGGTAALSLTAAGGPIVYTGGDVINNGNGNAFDVVQNGGVGSVDITAGNITAATGEGITVRDVATGTGISVTTNGAVNALSAGKDGIDAQSQSLTGNITIVANGDVNAGNAGIVGAIFPAAGTGNIDITANGAINARFGVDAENFGTGNTTVTTVGPVNATSGNGIFALTTGGNVTVTAGDVTSTGNTAVIARQTSAVGAGVIDVTVGNVSGTTGIEATNSGTGATNVTAIGTVTGTFAEGIKATGNDAVTISVADTVTGATNGLTLVGGTGGGGNISVTGTGGFVGGTGDAANIRNNGTGTVTVDISGASSSTAGEGIVVRDTAAGGDISVTTGAVTALAGGKDGIDVQSQSTTGNVTIVANGDINAGNAGIVGAIFPAGATGNVDVTANGAIDARFGVDAENFGTGNTSVATVGPVTATSGNGIFALTTGGNVTVTAGDVTSTSNTAIIARQTSAAGAGTIDVTAGNVSGTTGIEATNSGLGAISITANGTVTGTFAEGIKATGNDAVTVSVADTVIGATNGLTLVGGTGGAGNISVTGTGGFLGGTGDGANIQNNGSGTVTVDISGASGSTSGNGIIVRDTAAGGDINVTTGAVTALAVGRNAIDVQSLSNTANITIVANGDVQAGNAGIVGAIFPAGATGNVDVTANGAIDARFGVDAENFGTGNTTVTTVGPVNVTTGNGVFALTTGGNVTVTAGDVTSIGNTAIIARQTNAAGGGVIDVTGGNVSGTTGIEATNAGTGATNVTANGTVTGTFAEGIRAIGNDAVSVTVADAVTGATNGLTLVGGTGGAGNISVTGTGGFFGGSGDGANILNNGSGTVTVDVSSPSGSTGGNGFIVRDTAAGGDISVTTGAVTALTAGKIGVDVLSLSNTANVTIVANGDVDAGLAGLVGVIQNGAATGNIDVTANGAVSGAFGAVAENLGAGNSTVTTVGPVTATTGNGIYALTTGGNVTVTAGDVSSTGDSAIFARQSLGGGAGTVDVTAANVSGTRGVDAQNIGTGTVSVTTTGTVTGTVTEGILALGNDAVTVNVADTVTGATNGLSLAGGTGGAGNISVTGTGGFVGQNGDGASIQNNGSGTVTVDISGASAATNGTGIYVRDTAIGGDISVTAGAVTALSAGMNGIDVQSVSTAGNLTIVANGDVQAGNAGIVGAIFPAGATGNIDVTANNAIDARFGVDAENFGTGNTSVTTIGPVNVTSGNGIYALTTGGNVSVAAGDVTSTGNTAIIAQQVLAGGAGNVDVTANGTVTGTSSIVALTNGTGNVSVMVAGSANSTAGDAVTALNNGAAANSGTIDVAVATGGTVTAVGGTGILTDSGLSNGLATITLDGDVTGSADGVNATADSGALLITGSGGSATGQTGNGITAFTNTGAIDITATGSATGNVDGINAQSVAGNINISGTGAVLGTTGFGILGFSGAGNVSIDTAGPVTSTGGEAIRGQVNGLSTVSVTTAGTVTSNGIGIQAQSVDGIATITTNGDVVADSVGILGNVVGAGSVTINANAGVSAANGDGIYALLQGAGAGTITINQGVGSLITATDGAGIRTNSGTSTGATNIVIAGEVSASGAGNAGVYATSTAGDINVLVTATGSIDPAIGMALNTVNGALLINNYGLISGTTTGAQLVATGSGTGTINNYGTIAGGTYAVVGQLNNRPFTIYNAGTLNGAVNVQGSTVAISQFINAPVGVANLTGNSVFAGNLSNGGNVNLGSGATLLILGGSQNAGRMTFAGAGSFTTQGFLINTGIINAQNNLTSNVVTVGGNYTGGGQFFADYSTATATADRLNIAGTASGNTNVTLNRVGGHNFVTGGFLPVVTVAPGAAVGTFTSNTVFPTTGFILEHFGRNPSNTTQFGLIQAVNPTAMAVGDLTYMAEAASGLLDDPISPYVTNRSDVGGTRVSLWMRGGGGHTTQTIDSSLAGGGLLYTSTTRLRTDHHAAQIGADVAFGGLGSWKVNAGVMGGWYGASAPVSSSERIKVETPFVGGYLVVGNGAFELEGNIRKEWRHYTLAMPSLFGTIGTQRMRGDATAGSIRASYRIGGATGFAATPFASFSYADTNIDPLVIDAFSVWTPGSDTTKIGQAGLRLSYRGGSAATATFEPFVSAARLENWSRTDSSSFAFGSPVTSFSLDTATWKDAMRYSAGLLVNAHGGRVTGFVAGNVDDDARLRTFTINAGLRFNF